MANMAKLVSDKIMSTASPRRRRRRCSGDPFDQHANP
jgi:hypothetical protein